MGASSAEPDWPVTSSCDRDKEEDCSSSEGRLPSDEFCGDGVLAWQ